MILEQQNTTTTYNLGDGLRLRFATVDDIEALAQFNGRIHGDDGFNAFVAQWTREFASPSHPTCGPDNVTMVEDTSTGQIVSSMCLIPQTWTFDGIPFPVGRPEAVGTDPAYRRRGLVRAQFDVLHAKSDGAGHLAQGITGIPWYYRQFGYEYAIDLDGGRCVYPALIAPLKEGEARRIASVVATPDDLPLVMELYDRDCARSLVACPRSAAEWRRIEFRRVYRVAHAYSRAAHHRDEREAAPIGVIRTSRELSWRGLFPVRMFSVIEGQSLRAVLPSALRWLKVRGRGRGGARRSHEPALHFELGEQHPVFEAAPECFHKTIAVLCVVYARGRCAEVPQSHRAGAGGAAGAIGVERLLGRDQGDGICARLQVEDRAGEDQRGSVDARRQRQCHVPAVHVPATVVRAALVERSALHVPRLRGAGRGRGAV